MHHSLGLLTFAILLAGCLTPDESRGPTPDVVTPTAPPTPASASCATLEVSVNPASAPMGAAREFVAQLTNCGNETLQLSHACVRGMDLRILVLYNSTTPDQAAPPGVGPKATYLVDNPIANLPLLCATAPPHVRDVPAGETLVYAVSWSGLYAPPGCAEASCAKMLERGQYILAATAEDALTREALIATTPLILT